MTAKLIVTSGANRGTQFPLADRIIFNIGSDRASTVFLDDAKISPNHCRLYKEDSKFTLFDVSGKGLSVNGKKVVKAVLAEGDLIQIGDTEIRFTTGETPAPQVAAPAPAARPEGVGMAAAPAEPRGYSRVWLQCVEGNDKGKTFDLSEGSVWVIGRGHSADITVMDIKVSRAHCRIDRQANTFYVNDLNSTNGSFLNGQQIERQALHRGDYIKVGYSILSFQYDELADAVAAQPAAPQPQSWAAPAPPGPTPAWLPPPAAPAARAPAPWNAGATSAEDDHRHRGILQYEEVQVPGEVVRTGRPAPPPIAAQTPLQPPDDDVPLNLAALDENEGAAQELPPPPVRPLVPPQAPWSQPQPPPAPREPPIPGVPPQAWPPREPAPLIPSRAAQPEPRSGAPPAWAPAKAEPPAWPQPPSPGAPGQLPPPPPAPGRRTGDMMVPNLDEDQDLFAGGGPAPGWDRGDAPAAPPPRWGAAQGPEAQWAPPPEAQGWQAPMAAPAPAPARPPQRTALISGAPSADAVPLGGERRYKTGELPVSDYLVRGGPAPPPISSEANAPLGCFLCHRPFSQDDMRQNRLRKIKDHYYCLHCVQEA